MSSFHPLGSSADADPLTAAAPAELRFHHNDDDDDSWTPPSLPGDTRILPRSSASAGRTRSDRGGGTKGITDPLHNNNSAGGSFASGGGDGADGAAAEEESYSRAVRNNGGAIGNNAAPTRGQREWERGPTPAAGGETDSRRVLCDRRLFWWLIETNCCAKAAAAAVTTTATALSCTAVKVVPYSLVKRDEGDWRPDIFLSYTVTRGRTRDSMRLTCYGQTDGRTEFDRMQMCVSDGRTGK